MAITSNPGPIAGQTTLPEITTTEQTTGDTGGRAPASTGETESGRGQDARSQIAQSQIDRGRGERAPADRGPALRVELSEEAAALLASRDAPGKSGNSPAQLARSLKATAGEAVGEYKNFGQLVSSIARGEFSLAAPSDAGVPDEGSEAAAGDAGPESPEGGVVIDGEESGPLVQLLEEDGVGVFQAASDESAVALEASSLVEAELSLLNTPVLPGLATEAAAVEESLVEELLEASATSSSDS